MQVLGDVNPRRKEEAHTQVAFPAGMCPRCIPWLGRSWSASGLRHRGGLLESLNRPQTPRSVSSSEAVRLAALSSRGAGGRGVGGWPCPFLGQAGAVPEAVIHQIHLDVAANREL